MRQGWSSHKWAAFWIFVSLGICVATAIVGRLPGAAGSEANGAEIVVPYEGGTVTLDVSVIKIDLEPETPQAPPLGLLLWQIPGANTTESMEWMRRTLSIFDGIQVTAQNGWPYSFTDANFAEKLPDTASACAEIGYQFQPYLSTRSGYITPAAFDLITAWPDNVRAVMLDSERKVFPLSVYTAIQEKLPAGVLLAAPEGIGITFFSVLPTQQLLQCWLRVTGKISSWVGFQRRYTNINAVMALARRFDRPIQCGPQLWNSTYYANETNTNLARAVYQVAFEAVRSLDPETLNIVCWGASHITGEEPLRAVVAAIKHVNALDIPVDTRRDNDPQVAVLMTEYTQLPWFQTQLFWEMVVRSNVPYDVLLREDITTDKLTQYRAVLIPELTNEALARFTESERVLLEAYGRGSTILTSCGDVGEYRGVPTWTKTFLSARHDRTPPEWYPMKDWYMGGNYDERLRDLIDHYRDVRLAPLGVVPLEESIDVLVMPLRRSSGKVGRMILDLMVPSLSVVWDEE